MELVEEGERGWASSTAESSRGQGNSESRVSRDTVHPSLTGNFIPSSSLSLSLVSSFFPLFPSSLSSFFLSVFFPSLQLLYPKVSALESVRESLSPSLIQFISALSLGWPSSCFRALHSTVKGKVCNEISSESEPRRSLCPEV